MRGLAIVVVAACRFSAAGAPDAADIGSDAGAHDARGDAGSGSAAGCWSIWEHGAPSFSTPIEITGLLSGDNGNGFDERDPFISADDLTLYFSSDLGGTFEVYATTRGSAGGTFGTAMKVTAIDNGSSVSKISFTADGAIAVYASDPGNNDDLYESQVAAGVVEAGSTANLNAIDTPADQGDPALTPSGDHLYFSDTSSGGNQFLAMTARTGSADSPFGPETTAPFATIAQDGAAEYADPSISGDELVLVFTEYNSIVDSVFYATRSSTADPFGSAQPISVADIDGYNDDGQLSADGCTLYFASGRGHDDIQKIYVTTVSP